MSSFNGPNNGGSGGGVEESPASIKVKYESNADTNAFTNAEKDKLQSLNPSGGTGDEVVAVRMDVVDETISTTITKNSGDIVSSIPVVLPASGEFLLEAADNTIVKVVNNKLVASRVTEDKGSIEVAPQSISVGAHKISSVGDALGVMNKATEQQRVLLFQDLSGGIAQRPYTYKMSDDEWRNVETTPGSTSALIKDYENIVGMVASGYYIIKPDSIRFTLDEAVTEFTFTIYDLGRKVFERTYLSNGNELQILNHEAVIIDGASDITFAVTDLDANPIAVMGEGVTDIQKYEFTIRDAERAYLAYENENSGDGSGGEYPKNPVFETVKLDMFAGADADKYIDFLSDDLIITNENDGAGVVIEGSYVKISAGESDVTVDSDVLDVGFKEVVNAQSGNKSTSLTTLAQVESMLKNLFLRKSQVTLNNNLLTLDTSYAGKNVFVKGSGLESGIVLDSANFANFQVVQLTRDTSYTNAALPVTIKDENREFRFLVQGTTTFGVYDNTWIVLSDASVTLSDPNQRTAYEQYVRIRAGQGMTSYIDSFGTMTLDVTSSEGESSIEADNNYLVIAKDKKAVQSAFYQDMDKLVCDAGVTVGGHTIESIGDSVSVSDKNVITQGLNSLNEYKAPEAYKEELSSSTYFTVNQTNQSFTKPFGQEIRVTSDFTHLRIHPNSLHFNPNQVGDGYLLTIKDDHETVVFRHKSNQVYSTSTVLNVLVPNITLRANTNYTIFVNDLSGNPVTLKGNGDIQKFGFDYQDISINPLLTKDDLKGALPESLTFNHIKTNKISDLNDAYSITFNGAGYIETNCDVSLDHNQLVSVGDATAGHAAPNLSQVNRLIENAEFVQSIAVDGQPVEAITLNEDDFTYTYHPLSKSITLSVIHKGGSNTEGSVYPITIEGTKNNGCIVEFASTDGTAIRSTGVSVNTLVDGISNANQLADKANNMAIGADVTAGTALTATGANSATLAHHTTEFVRIRAELDATSAATLRNGRGLTQTRRETDMLERRSERHETELRKHDEWMGFADTSFDQIHETFASMDKNIQLLDTNTQHNKASIEALTALGLDSIAKGEFVDMLSVSDAIHGDRVRHIIRTFGPEVIYDLPPALRTATPKYAVSITDSDTTTEVLRVTTTEISACLKPIKNLVDATDDTDATTLGQVKTLLQAAFDRLDVIEEELGIASPPESFSVYSGRIATKTTSDPNEIISAGNVQHNVTADTMLNGLEGDGYLIQGHNSETLGNASYSIIAYPKNVLKPNPTSVGYEGFKASRDTFEIVINGVRYVVLVPDNADISPIPANYTIMQ